MPIVYEILSPDARLALAVRTRSPHQLARAFAAYAGQFYDRSTFDDLARRVSDLYADENSLQASEFRQRLNRRLRDRYHEPVIWETAGPEASSTA